MAIALSFPPAGGGTGGGGGTVRIVAPLCAAGGKADFTNKNISFSALLINTSSPSATFSSASAYPVTIDNGMVTCDPNGVGLVPGLPWTTDVEGCGSLSAPTLGLTFGVSFSSDPSFTGPFTATIYVDDIEIK
jgi:hypothetical protein